MSRASKRAKAAPPIRGGEQYMANIIRNNHVANCATGFKPTSKSERAERPDPCDFEEVEARLHDRAWFLVKTKPGEEFRVVWRLAEKRMFAATPVEQRWRFWNEKHKDKTRRDFPGLPGYVAVAQPLDHRARRWVTVMTCDGVTAILGEEWAGHPVQISAEDVMIFTHGLSSNAPDREAFMATGGEFNEGDEVRIGDPNHPFVGQVGKAVSIAKERTTVFLSFLGTLREVSVSTRAVEKVAT